MVCLYLYTNLPLLKIVDVVHHKSPLGNHPPGVDSANKNLNALLDKEPRWLHPRSNEDMSRRLEQLALSPSRMSSRSSDSSFHHASSQPSVLGFPPHPFKSEGGASPTLLDVPLHSMDSWSAATSPEAYYQGPVEWSPYQSFQSPQTSAIHPKEDEDEVLFAPFLRRTTMASSSTATSASSLRTILAEYSSPYRGVVKGLMRRLPGFSPNSRNMSPVSESNSGVMDWLDAGEAPTPYEGTPFPLPGDFLSIDLHGQCRQLLADAGDLLRTPAAALPWVTPNGLTEKGERILAGIVLESDYSEVDAFGNTLLHFVAARSTAGMLYDTIRHPTSRGILHQRNSAGQSFLHVMDHHIMKDTEFMSGLVHALRQGSDLDIYAQDHYGRNFFHILRASGISQAVLEHIFDPTDAVQWNTRDAFGEEPHLSVAQMSYNLSRDSASQLDGALHATENSAVTTQLQLVTFINRALLQDPLAEYTHGRNGLHCLATANLSMATGTTSSLNMAESAPSPAIASGATTPSGRRRASSVNKRETDSSDNRMAMRLESLKDLLNAGVRPNAYDANGNTPLMAFAAQLPEDGNYRIGPEILRTLINSGGRVNARNRAGETALHVAVRCGRKLAVRTLVGEGANVYARDAAGRSVLDVADARIMAASGGCPREYARLEACRAWLSGQKGGAIQNPTVLDEWGCR
ncbi:ankyrin repeat-containing domain protein [Cordyceps fumosorosea ARSEF 2679]|uniref:Ankyrin repeat-containing domain protein n=1 Tax=Cordyceps fumosorosea (strain ARSEF 2679) TaxID=1081104 RepID=A0A167QPL4_CORFA|nr:ankyrin repeat-containing domain protein [Cordyceps fumosorosea ARSEF 2679]OAA57829.1 ankyrin repeat-containing domain protein [Cordyceps fumosorosea ARSEF 2679]